jgi:phospholipid/cholesterol/gamma-HCH transport system ATP-binding protein
MSDSNAYRQRAQPEKVVAARNVTAGYNGDTVLRDVSVDIPGNEISVILGESGCGKTTLLKNMIGLLKPAEGSIDVLGKDILTIDENEYNELMRSVGVLFQGGALLNSIPVYQNVAIPLEQHTDLPPSIIESIVRLKLSLVGLEHAYNLLPSQLSGGMRKRAALARAIALDPVILFADEPTAGLDPVTARSLDDLLLSLREQLGMTLVVVTHEISSIRRVADRIIFLHDGKAIFSGTLDEALHGEVPEIQKFFSQ